MEKIGVRKIWFSGSRQTFERLVWKKEDGTFWIRWYFESVQVKQAEGTEYATCGWRTVEPY